MCVDIFREGGGGEGTPEASGGRRAKTVGPRACARARAWRERRATRERDARHARETTRDTRRDDAVRARHRVGESGRSARICARCSATRGGSLGGSVAKSDQHAETSCTDKTKSIRTCVFVMSLKVWTMQLRAVTTCSSPSIHSIHIYRLLQLYYAPTLSTFTKRYLQVYIYLRAPRGGREPRADACATQ